MVAHTPDVADPAALPIPGGLNQAALLDAPSPAEGGGGGSAASPRAAEGGALPTGASEVALFDAFISGVKSLITLCTEFSLSLGQLCAWANTPRIRAALDAAAELTARREPFLESATRLAVTQGFTAIIKAIPPHDPASAPPDLKRDALHARMRETARKAAGQLLRMLTPPPGAKRPGSGSDRAMPGREPDAAPVSHRIPSTPTRGTSVPPVPTEPPMPSGVTPGRTAGNAARDALSRALDKRHPLAAAAGR